MRPELFSSGSFSEIVRDGVGGLPPSSFSCFLDFLDLRRSGLTSMARTADPPSSLLSDSPDDRSFFIAASMASRVACLATTSMDFDFLGN